MSSGRPNMNQTTFHGGELIDGNAREQDRVKGQAENHHQRVNDRVETTANFHAHPHECIRGPGVWALMIFASASSISFHRLLTTLAGRISSASWMNVR